MKNTSSNLSFIVTFVSFLLIGCNGGNAPSTYEQDYEVGNPYTEGTGHYAGYEWAESTGGDCDGNSNSFNEGCEEYYRQLEQ
jgi:hypothetical protein